MSITEKNVMKSESFFIFAAMEALKIIAESNGRPMSDAITAFKLGAPDVVKEVQALVKQAALDLAKSINDLT